MEGHLRPLPGWDAFDEGGRQLFQQLRAPGTGEQMVLEDNSFLDTLLQAGLVWSLSLADLAVYRSPYPDPDSRRPPLRCAREIPVAGEPVDVHQLMSAAAGHLESTRYRPWWCTATPGVLVTADTAAWCRSHLRSLTVRHIGGPAGHFLPEDRPEEVADALLGWVRELRSAVLWPRPD